MISIIKNVTNLPYGISLSVYGAGGRGKNILSSIITHRPDIGIKRVFDDYMSGDKLLNYTITKYTKNSIKESDYILVASIHVHEIIKKLHPTENIILIEESNSLNIDQKIGFVYFFKNAFKLLLVIYKLKNKFTYISLLLRRIGVKINISKFLLNGDYKKQYLDFIIKDKIINAYDLGVHDGYTSLQFINNFKNLKNIYGFDITPDALNKSINRKILNDSNFFVLNTIAIHNYIGYIKININSDNLSASSVNILPDINQYLCTNTLLTVPCTTIDQVRIENNSKIDFIKFDIEGAEIAAIEGGIKTFIKDRPQLAVSIYHSSRDFIQIPIFLINNLKNYQFFIGHYSTGIYETVLYCIPKELNEYYK